MSNEINKQEALKAIEAVKKKYSVRTFKTTSEAMTFMRKMSPAIAQMQELKKANVAEAGAKMFEIFDDEFIKYVVSNFVFKKGKKGKPNKKIDYESEFVNDYETCIKVFMMAITTLMEKAQGKNEPQKKETDTAIKSTQR